MINSDQAKAIGIRGYVMKPILKMDLVNIIRNALDENKKAVREIFRNEIKAQLRGK